MVDPAAALFEFPEMFTYHVPDARPDSENVTENVWSVKDIEDADVDAPVTCTEPEYAFGA